MSELATQTVLTLKRQPGTGALIGALEHAWRTIQRHHPDVPAAQVIVGQGSGHGRGLLLGHLAPDRWQPTGQPDAFIHELLIAGEGLALGADEVFTTELHEKHGVSDATYQRAVNAFGEHGVADLIAVTGYYVLVAMTVNVDRTPMPGGAALPLPRLKR